MTTPSLLQQQSEIMNRFNFDYVLKVMQLTNWTWAGEAVTIDGLKRTAMHLMDNVCSAHDESNSWASVATGGLEARIDVLRDGRAQLSLTFVAEGVDGSLN